MPIPKHLRHLYRGKAYNDFRAALLKRAKNRCEQCSKPNHTRVLTHTPLNVLELRMCWKFPGSVTWIGQDGRKIHRLTHLHALRHLGAPRSIKVILTAAHLNQTPGDDRMENGRMLCQWCHLHHDMKQHVVNAKETRLNRKDGARGLLQETA